MEFRTEEELILAEFLINHNVIFPKNFLEKL